MLLPFESESALQSFYMSNPQGFQAGLLFNSLNVSASNVNVTYLANTLTYAGGVQELFLSLQLVVQEAMGMRFCFAQRSLSDSERALTAQCEHAMECRSVSHILRCSRHLCKSSVDAALSVYCRLQVTLLVSIPRTEHVQRAATGRVLRRAGAAW